MKHGIVALLLGVSTAACFHLPEPNAVEMARAADELERVLPLLDELGVQEYRNQDWCRTLDYRGGAFSTNLESSTCNLFEETPVEFTEQGDRDFNAVRAALAGTGVRIRMVSRLPAIDEWKARTEFNAIGGDFDSWYYVYESGYVPHETIEGEWVPTWIDADWFFVWMDWN